MLEDYYSLLKESQYLAWYVTNFFAINTDSDSNIVKQPLNHFAYTINNHHTLNSCKAINKKLILDGIDINIQNGKDVQIEKYSENETFEQSSTKSNEFLVTF